ncbi:MAG: TfoX/Sxy family protein [Rhodobacteraceae bacterium]|nr:TfoX/Sxy family protein [Paracoccaceae bacterium]
MKKINPYSLKEQGSRRNHDKKDGKQGHMNYWTLPEAALDDPDTASEWANASLDAN